MKLIKIKYLFFCITNAKLVTISKMNKGSVPPINEFAIILGSNIKNIVVIIANDELTNFFAKKYNGIIVNKDSRRGSLRDQ